uniref:Uncharacterized protein n=1 Tax=Cannabis sativa TaxID=3483 RepID=A0A803Q7N6_CANSA
MNLLKQQPQLQLRRKEKTSRVVASTPTSDLGLCCSLFQFSVAKPSSFSSSIIIILSFNFGFSSGEVRQREWRKFSTWRNVRGAGELGPEKQIHHGETWMFSSSCSEEDAAEDTIVVEDLRTLVKREEKDR